MLTVLISKACIFDWAGTVCDAGVFAPVLTFQKLFEDEGVPITSQEVREPMGVHKRVSEYDYTILYYTKHSAQMVLAAVCRVLSMSANPANTDRAAVQCTEQLLCLCWLDWRT